MDNFARNPHNDTVIARQFSDVWTNTRIADRVEAARRIPPGRKNKTDKAKEFDGGATSVVRKAGVRKKTPVPIDYIKEPDSRDYY